MPNFLEWLLNWLHGNTLFHGTALVPLLWASTLQLNQILPILTLDLFIHLLHALVHNWAFSRMVILFLWWNWFRLLLNETEFLSALVVCRLLHRSKIGRWNTRKVLWSWVILRAGVQARDFWYETILLGWSLWGFYWCWGCIISLGCLCWRLRCLLPFCCLCAGLHPLHVDDFEVFLRGDRRLFPFSVWGNIVFDKVVYRSYWAFILL